jgi:hypothetical protein
MQPSTVHSEQFRELVSCRDSGCRVLTMPTPKSGWREPEETRLLNVEKALKNLASDIADLKAAPNSTAEGWIKRHTHLWPLPALAVAVLAFLFGTGQATKLFTLIFNSYFDDRLKSDGSVLVINDHIDHKLAQPIKDLQQISINVEKINYRLELQDNAVMKSQAFKNSLPGLADTLKQSEKINVQVSPGVSDGIRHNLQITDKAAPGYWQATSQFISYQSAQESKQSLNPQSQSLPPCNMDNNQIATLAEPMTASQTTMKLNTVPFENCEVVLDSPEAQRRFLRVLGVIDIEFVHCRIVYRGGPILFPAQALPGRKTMSLIFKDGVYDLATPNVPHKDG